MRLQVEIEIDQAGMVGFNENGTVVDREVLAKAVDAFMESLNVRLREDAHPRWVKATLKNVIPGRRQAASVSSALRVKCPHCCVDPGEWCLTVTRLRAQYLHHDRHQVAKTLSE